MFNDGRRLFKSPFPPFPKGELFSPLAKEGISLNSPLERG
jgi:hypothetical protein